MNRTVMRVSLCFRFAEDSCTGRRNATLEVSPLSFATDHTLGSRDTVLGTDMASLLKLTFSAPTRALAKGDVLVTQGDVGRDLYVLERAVSSMAATNDSNDVVSPASRFDQSWTRQINQWRTLLPLQ